MQINTSKIKSTDISVVIPTLGGDCLNNTVATINAGSLVPKEIIICIPSDNESSILYLQSIANVRILPTAVKGQVAQRAEGLKAATSSIVIQLDDDIHMDATAIKLLVEALISLGRCNVVGPILLDRASLHSMHAIGSCLDGLVANLFYTLICGAKWGRERMGTISSAGIGFGIGEAAVGADFIRTEWLPGGCVASYREDLITHNYYPFSGKAFYEDFIHSYLRSERNQRHWVVRGAICSTDCATRIRDRESFDRNRSVRRYYVKMRGIPKLRLLIYEAIEWIRFSVIRL